MVCAPEPWQGTHQAKPGSPSYLSPEASAHTVPSASNAIPPLPPSMATASSALSFVSLVLGRGGALPGTPRCGTHLVQSGHLAASGEAISSQVGKEVGAYSLSLSLLSLGASTFPTQDTHWPLVACNARIASVSQLL